MTKEQCYKDLKEIFTKPCKFSVELPEGQSYIHDDNGYNRFIVSKQWGYWMIVIQALQDYFEKNGPLDDGGVKPSNNDIIGTVVEILPEEELYTKK